MSNNELRNRLTSTSDDQTNQNSSSNNDLNNQNVANENRPTNSHINRFSLDTDDFVYLLNFTNLNWRLMISPLLNLFNFNNNPISQRPQASHSSNNERNNQPNSESNSEPNQHLNTDQNRQAAPDQTSSSNVPSNAPSNASSDNHVTETVNIHLNVNFDQNTVFINRSHLIRVIFFKIAAFYVIFFPSKVRKAFEYGLLASAILSFLTLIYLHMLFIRNPLNCLQNLNTNWTGEGILRVEILDEQEKMINFNLDKNSSTTDLDKNLKEFEIFSKQVRPSNFYVVEYSLEHGFLRLSQDVRSKLNISIVTVTLDPNKDKCFGDQLSRFILKYFLGYNDILLNSLKGLAENQSSKGYIKNLVTDEYYRFVNIWMTRFCYIPAAFIMLLFTLTISMLIRYSHHQILILTMQIFNMLQPNSTVNFPFAQICTVILALIGMEAIMSEFFFNDTNIALNVILIVWGADIFDWACCNTVVTKRNWLKFFYLYHFVFYAYAYRFNGQYSSLALLTSGLFTAHSMVFFLHHYEIPFILALFSGPN